LAEELAWIVYHVLNKGEDSNGRFKGVLLSRVKQEQWPLPPSPDSITGPEEGPGPDRAGPRSASVGIGGE
jgi:hypothetical protein